MAIRQKNMKIIKGDTISVIAGKDKGREGKVERVYPKSERVLIENINMFKKHVKKTEETPQGGIIEISRPLRASNVMIICPKCKKPSKMKFDRVDGKKVRVCKKCKKQL